MMVLADRFRIMAFFCRSLKVIAAITLNKPIVTIILNPIGWGHRSSFGMQRCPA